MRVEESMKSSSVTCATKSHWVSVTEKPAEVEQSGCGWPEYSAPVDCFPVQIARSCLEVWMAMPVPYGSWNGNQLRHMSIMETVVGLSVAAAVCSHENLSGSLDYCIPSICPSVFLPHRKSISDESVSLDSI